MIDEKEEHAPRKSPCNPVKLNIMLPTPLFENEGLGKIFRMNAPQSHFLKEEDS